MNGTGVRTADPDLQIVERIRGGEAGLYEVLIRRHNQRLYRVARVILRGDAGVEDVMQETYLKAFAALPRFQGRARFSTWLTRILITSALSHLRSRSRRAEVPLENAPVGSDATPAPIAMAEQRIAREEVARLIEGAVDALPDAYRVVFVMRELEEMSVAETAASLGISVANVKVRLHRAKTLLKRALADSLEGLPYPFLGDRCDAFTRRVMARILATS